MAILSPGQARRSGRRPGVLTLLSLVLAALLPTGLPAAAAQSAAAREYQLKAVFLLNFTQFVDWPDSAFASDKAPIVIGVLGDDPFGADLEAAVRGETAHDRPIVVNRYRRVEDVTVCHVLYVSRSETARLDPVLTALKGRPILTVGEIDPFALSGGMIRFTTENNRVRLRINVEVARAAGLTISSKLLRPAEIVTTKKG